ncbi:MAG: diphosphate--fructose-6-phosphate 1-phosphotransferase [Bacteroidales bacterium]|jgi:6-phosphofructokinase 1|nr:diphosphate--fructose-6-phosphate 1-phosphotransferase [Bacteroidales bacterium]
MIKGNAVIGQSGGPTSVINSSLAGVVNAASNSGIISGIYGMNYGIEGFMKEWLINLGAQPDDIISGLRRTPSSALGSSRHKLREEDFPKILSVLEKYDIRYIFMIGGNDTMDTINRVETYCRNHGYELTGVGIPKTVDNDLFGTDHTPGFASAAWSNILNVMQAGVLARDMKMVDQFVVYQTIGRDAGWLAAATAVARREEEDAPHLIYTPEHHFDKDKFLADADQCLKRYGWLSVVCGEGVKYSDGTPVSASVVKDKFSNTEFGAMGGASVAITLHGMISSAFGIRGEFQVPESLIMSDVVRALPSDLDEAWQCGIEAVRMAERGESGYMVTIDRLSDDPYEISYGKVPLGEVAIAARPMPGEYFNDAGNFVSDAFMKYMKPLTGELPDFVRLKKVMVLK